MRLSASFSRLVRRILRREGISTRELANRADMPESTAYRITAGEQKVSLDQADDIADGLDVPLPRMVAASQDLADGGPDTQTPDLRPGPVSLRVAGIVRDRMQELGVDEATLAGRTGLPQPAVEKMLAGQHAIYLDDLHVIVQALDLDPIAVINAATG